MTESDNDNSRHLRPASFYSKHISNRALSQLKAYRIRNLSFILVGALAVLGMPVALALREQPSNSSVSMTASQLHPTSPSLLRQDAGNVNAGNTPSSTPRSVSRSQNSTRVTVNGQAMPVPANGTVHKTLPSTNTQSSVDVTIQNRSSGTSSPRTRSSTSINIQSHSSSSSSSVNSQTRRGYLRGR